MLDLIFLRVTVLLILKLAWRNFQHNKKNIIFTIIIIAVAVTILICGYLYTAAIIDLAYSRIIDLGSAHIKVLPHNYDTAAVLSPEVSYIWNLQELIPAIEIFKGVESSSARIEVEATLDTGIQSVKVLLCGIAPEKEYSVRDLNQYLLEGRYLSSGDKDKIMISSDMARSMELRVGDRIELSLNPDRDGPEIREPFTIGGIYSTNDGNIKQAKVFIPLHLSQNLLGLDRDSATEIAIKVKNVRDTESIAGLISAEFAGEEQSFRITAWQEFLPGLNLLLFFAGLINIALTASTLLVIAAALFVALSARFYGRRKVMAALFAFGFRRQEMFASLLAEGLLIFVTSFIIAAALSIPLLLLMSNIGVALPETFSNMLAAAKIYPGLKLSCFIEAFCLVFVASATASAIPAFKAISRNSVEDLRNG